jgi:hypothetical protein
MVMRFMTTIEATPIKWILDARTYRLKIRYNTTVDGLVAWQDNQITY